MGLNLETAGANFSVGNFPYNANDNIKATIWLLKVVDVTADFDDESSGMGNDYIYDGIRSATLREIPSDNFPAGN